jgi:hypothetical protein
MKRKGNPNKTKIGIELNREIVAVLAARDAEHRGVTHGDARIEAAHILTYQCASLAGLAPLSNDGAQLAALHARSAIEEGVRQAIEEILHRVSCGESDMYDADRLAALLGVADSAE